MAPVVDDLRNCYVDATMHEDLKREINEQKWDFLRIYCENGLNFGLRQSKSKFVAVCDWKVFWNFLRWVLWTNPKKRSSHYCLISSQRKGQAALILITQSPISLLTWCQIQAPGSDRSILTRTGSNVLHDEKLTVNFFFTYLKISSQKYLLDKG